ncbi:hypothetical protein [Flammeovirga agarivorans]|uniref:Uncharacterized protein n=1 Tax=Flammeovirga agarivorans TaxID=2726742 RepID=A0A7X8SR43_9BACT|nr:hypothetical protein [Flammeovirga agarivorans]NLR94874.1 hypothetical protein [Flammeovirga agarivorans]
MITVKSHYRKSKSGGVSVVRSHKRGKIRAKLKKAGNKAWKSANKFVASPIGGLVGGVVTGKAIDGITKNAVKYGSKLIKR